MPASYLKIGGELISNAILVTVEVTQELNQHSSCSIECRQTEDVRFPVEESLGKDVQVLTYDQDGAEHVAFDGFVLEGELEYEIYGSYTARLTAVSRSYKLDCTPQEAYWRKKTLSDVAQALAAEDGLQAKVRCASKPSKNYVQWGETDFAFLKRIADDYHAWIRPSADGIEICDSFQPGGTLEWRKEDGLLSFRMKGRLAQPSFQGTHYNARTMTSQTLRQIQKDADFTGASGQMVSAVQRASKATLPSGHVHTDGRAATEQEFHELLERESMRSIGGGFVGYGESRGEQLRAGDLVQIQGNLDAQGAYGLIRVVHRWTRKGYTNQFWCTPWKKYLSPTPPSAQRIYGVVTGRVTNNNDPRKMGRLQVQYDWQEDGATGWARMVTPHAGSDRGFLFLPEIGDEVLITFEHGDPERPYIVGSLWNGIDQAPRQEFWGADVDPNDVKRIVTKSGHRIQFSDKEGKESIVIATPSRLKISLLEKTDETGRPMILMHAAEGDIVFSASNGRIHFHSKYFSREVGATDSAFPQPLAPSKRTGVPSLSDNVTALSPTSLSVSAPITKLQELEHAREMSSLAENVYLNSGAPPGYKRLNENHESLPPLLRKLPFNDSASGFDSALYETPDGRIVIAYRGTEGRGDWKANLKQNAGFQSEQYDEAVRLAKRVKSAYPGRTIEITGHSLGGGLSQAASAATGIPATTFNAAGVNEKTFLRYAADKHSAKVINYTVEGEILTGLQETKGTPLMRAVGKRMPLEARDQDGIPLKWNPLERHGMASVNKCLDYAITQEKEKQ